MSDASIPPAMPQEGRDKKSSIKKNGKKSGDESTDNVAPLNKNKRAKPKSSSTAALTLIIVVLETLAFDFWQLADILNGLECAFFHLLSISCSIGGLAIGVERLWKRPKSICGAYAVICLLIGLVVFENSRSSPGNSAESKPVGMAKSLEWQPPELPAGCKAISLVAGDGESTMPLNPGMRDQKIGWLAKAYQKKDGSWGVDPIIGGHVSKNRFYADVVIPGGSPFGPFKLSANKIEGHLPPQWGMNYDDNAIEIVDGNDMPIYQIVYKRPDVIEISGIFVVGDEVWTITRSGMRGRKFTEWEQLGGFKETSLGLRRIFKYPSMSYQGQRAIYSD